MVRSASEMSPPSGVAWLKGTPAGPVSGPGKVVTVFSASVIGTSVRAGGWGGGAVMISSVSDTGGGGAVDCPKLGGATVGGYGAATLLSGVTGGTKVSSRPDISSQRMPVGYLPNGLPLISRYLRAAERLLPTVVFWKNATASASFGFLVPLGVCTQLMMT